MYHYYYFLHFFLILNSPFFRLFSTCLMKYSFTRLFSLFKYFSATLKYHRNFTVDRRCYLTPRPVRKEEQARVGNPRL